MLSRFLARTLGSLLGLSSSTLCGASWAAPLEPTYAPSSVAATSPSGSSELALRAPLDAPAHRLAWMAPRTLRLSPSQATSIASNDPALAALDARIDALTVERSEQSLGGPIALMASGGAVLFVSAYVLFLNWVNDRTCVDSYPTDSCWNHDKVRTIGLVGVTGGAGMLLGGGLWLGDRIGTRRELGEELNQLRRERHRLERAPTTDDFALVGPSLGRPRLVRLTLEF